jgi:hypothetical protein
MTCLSKTTNKTTKGARLRPFVHLPAVQNSSDKHIEIAKKRIFFVETKRDRTI